MLEQEAKECLLTYLRQVDAMRTAHGDPAWVYQSHEGLVLAHGRWFDVQPTKIRGYAQFCYHNAWSTANRHHKKGWQFCEGYMVLSNGFITGHAWVMLPDGSAIDTTPESQLKVLGRFGIAFSRAFCIERHQQYSMTEKYSILQGDYQTRYSLLRHGVPEGALAPDSIALTTSHQTAARTQKLDLTPLRSA